MHELKVPLTDLYTGSTKKMAITRKKLNGDKMEKERKVLEVRIEPGMKEGSKIRFSGYADDKPGEEAGDIVMVITEKEHGTQISFSKCKLFSSNCNNP